MNKVWRDADQFHVIKINTLFDHSKYSKYLKYFKNLEYLGCIRNKVWITYLFSFGRDLSPADRRLKFIIKYLIILPPAFYAKK